MDLLGAHISVSGGVEKAPLRGRDLQCNAIQIFSKQQLRWEAKPLSGEEIIRYRENLEKSNINVVTVHNSYLINLGSPDKEKLKKSRDAFLEEIMRAGSLHAMGIVVHPGSHGKRITEDECLKIISESINVIISQTKCFKTKLLIENTAGQGSTVGYTFEHLAKIIDLVSDKSRIGICFDTCHALASGYDIRTEKTYGETFKKFDDIVGLDKIALFHINDSKKDVGTRIDRHENIGYGFLGKAPFHFLMNDTRFKKIPKILETPGGEEWFKTNLILLRSMVQDI
ncbi:MAG: deoxyribonuclease IV [Candidatus Loosdrechtia sp.]|uniref:deoxyribonuclease IV n=1 Tax=Candidatus Loosdrechtia sp. TaxID=3101272 RepID=UPI003A64B562|nr:MAG: deoxyribonuclease IV [Candidatus Jettenia sp. AMX2]